jgi:hypothetical protein
MNYETGPMANMVSLASRFMLAIPFVGLFLRMWGVESVDSANMKKLMKQGKNIGILPGGYE